jgi:response regulator RpfG family c-di-GMP phosphodiesterase
MGVLCNRSLFLADDLSNRLESQQDRLLQQEVERLTTLEAILTSCREMVRTTHARNIFEPDSVKRVAKYALSIAGEFKISESERQALRYGALFKDLGLALSLKDMMEQKVASTFEEAAVIKAQCDLVGKALATVPFFDPAMDFVRYRYERHDGKGGRFGIKGTDIPLGARILAVADTYDAMTSGRSPQGKLTPKLAMQKISEESGMRFDPRVVSAFLMLWKRKELGSALIEN